MAKTSGNYRVALIDELATLRAGETEMAEVLPIMWDAVQQPELAMLLRGFLRESRLHAAMLGKLQTTLGAVPASKRWEGLSAEIEETARHAFNTHDRQLRDLVLVSGMIRIKGLQIASYNVARSLAEHLPGDGIMDAIVSMLVTELEGDIRLGELAKGVL